MKINKSITKFLDLAKEGDGFWVEAAKIAFSLALDKRKTQKNMTSSDIAEKIGKSEAYVSKVFRGDQNFTIESMVKLARATGGQLHIEIQDEKSEIIPWNITKIQGAKRNPNPTGASETVIRVNFQAANGNIWKDEARLAA